MNRKLTSTKNDLNRNVEKLEISQSKSFFKNDLVKGIIIALLAALFTQILSYFFWTKQFYNNKEQKLYEFKLQSYEKFVSSTSTLRPLLKSRNKIFILKIKHFMRDFDIKSKGIYDKMTLDSLGNDDNNLMYLGNIYPELYKDFLNCNKALVDYTTASKLCRTLFDSSIIKKIDNFNILTTDREILLLLSRNNYFQKGDYRNIDTDSILNVLDNNLLQTQDSIIHSMSKQIKQYY